MALQRFKIALNAARYPLLRRKGNRAVFIPGLDSAPRTPRQYTGNDQSLDYNTAQAMFMSNVMPTGEGLASSGFRQGLIPDLTKTGFDYLVPLRDGAENITYYSPANGQNFKFLLGPELWFQQPWELTWGTTVSTSPQYHNFTDRTTKFSYTHVDGISLVCYSRLKAASSALDMSVMFWDATAASLLPITPYFANLPFPVGEIDGISSSNGFLIVWSGLSIAWARWGGATFNFSPFENGAYTGAGNQIPEDVQGPITAIVGTSGGFIVFTSRNAVAASYNSQNLVSPWVFKEISGAGGIEHYSQATVEGSLSAVYAYTTAGMQRISLNSSDLVFPQIADLVTGRVLEGMVPGTGAMYETVSTKDLAVKLTNVGNRFLVVSVGFEKWEYQGAYVYDMALERWGQLTRFHTDVLNYTLAPIVSAALFIPAPHGIAMMQEQGGVDVADWVTEDATITHQARLILGRVQISRARNTQLNRVEIEGMKAGTLTVIPSYDGATDAAAQTFVEVLTSAFCRTYGGLVDCKNFSLQLDGKFSVTTIILEAGPSGQF